MGSSTAWEYITLFFTIPLIEKSASGVCSSGRRSILVQLGMLVYVSAALDFLINFCSHGGFENIQCLEVHRIICLEITNKESIIPALIG